MLNVKALADEIAEDIWKRSDRLELTQVLEEFFYKRGVDSDDLAVADDFDRLRGAVSQRLARKIKEASNKGLAPRYVFAEFDSDHLIPRSNVVEDTVKDSMIEAAGALSWRAFEHFSAHVLFVNGARSFTARGTKEEGIDLFGLLNLGDVSGATLWHDAMLRIAGQVKRGNLGEPTVRQFHTDLNSLGEGKGRAYEQSPQWFKASSAPIVGVLFTGGRVAKTAAAWARNKGILARDVWQMVEDLLKRRTATPGLRQFDGQLFFDKDEFTGYFEGKP